jgi:hypothetical protein
MKKTIIFIFLLIGIISFSVAKKSESGFYILNDSELSRLFGNDEGCRGIGMLYLSEAMIKNKKDNASIKMKKSVSTTRDVVASYLKKINWNASSDVSKNINLYFQSKCSKPKRSEVTKIVPEVENVLSENNLINIDYTSENDNQTKGNKIEQFFNMIFKKNNNENSTKKKEEESNEEIYGSNECLKTVKVLSSFYNNKDKLLESNSKLTTSLRQLWYSEDLYKLNAFNQELISLGWNKSFDDEENLWLFYKGNCKKLSKNLLRNSYESITFRRIMEGIGMTVD